MKTKTQHRKLKRWATWTTSKCAEGMVYLEVYIFLHYHNNYTVIKIIIIGQKL
jgi:hypothetical protein